MQRSKAISKAKLHVESALHYGTRQGPLTENDTNKMQDHMLRAMHILSFGGGKRKYSVDENKKKLSDIQNEFVPGESVLNEAWGGINVVYMFKEKAIRLSKHARRVWDMQIWNDASMAGIGPYVFWQGYAVPEGSSLDLFMIDDIHAEHHVIVMEAFDTDMVDFTRDMIQEDNWHAIEVMVHEVINKTHQMATMLHLCCIDTKPANIVIKKEPFKVALIDFEDFCRKVPTAPNENEVQNVFDSESAFVIMILFLALHSMTKFHLNLFLPHTQKFRNKEPRMRRKIEHVWNQINAAEQASKYFKMTDFDDIFFLSTCPFPSSDGPREYTGYFDVGDESKAEPLISRLLG